MFFTTSIVVKFLQSISFLGLVLLLIFAYLLSAFAFALIYTTFDLLIVESGFHSSFYFSVITQSTVGYGDIQPKPVARYIVVAQITDSFIFFPLATGLLITKLLSGDGDAIEFNETLIFNPLRNRFEFRFYNKLAVPLHDVQLKAHLRRKQKTNGSEKGYVRYSVRLTSQYITFLKPRFPQVAGTFRLTKGHKGVLSRGVITLHPRQLEKSCVVELGISASTFSGTIHSAKEYSLENIKCGFHSRLKVKKTTTSGDVRFDWQNWKKFEPDNKVSRCHLCDDCQISCFHKDDSQA